MKHLWFFKKRNLAALSLFMVTAISGHTGEAMGWRFTPQLGFSPSNGILGLEIRRGHFSVSAGALIVFGGGFAGAKYYFTPERSSWYMGPFVNRYSAVNFVDNGRGGNRRDGHDTNSMAGVEAGYRWMFKRSWSFSFGIGAGVDHIRYTRNSTPSSSDTRSVHPLTLLFGYSF